MPVHAVEKPLGLTSHGAVARARRLLGTRRVGHAGTLDPLAGGVLVLLSGEATKLSPFVAAGRKAYLAWVAFGLGTPTLDAEPPAAGADLAHSEPGPLAALTAEAVRAQASRFLAVTSQRPPAFSAVKQAGQRSYAAARRGSATEPPARPVAYHDVELLAFAERRDALPATFARGPGGWGPTRAGAGRSFDLPPELAPLPTALFRLEVAAGTYIRSFARDLGAALDAPAHLSGLVRVAAGGIDLTRCCPLDDIATAPPLDPVEALPLPRLRLDAAAAAAVRQGKRPELVPAGPTVLLDDEGAVAAVVEPGSSGRARILRVWQRGLTP